ncbi:hypothetical protein NKH77_06965 [Streptomyces sp. M19]
MVRYRKSNFVTRRVAMPIGEADGRTTRDWYGSWRRSVLPGSTPRPSGRWMPGSGRMPRSRCRSVRRCTRRVVRWR